MRSLALASLIVLSVAGCESKDPAPPRVSAPVPSSTPGAAPQAKAAPPATIVFKGRTGAARTVGAVLEDTSKPVVTLSREGGDTTFVAALPVHRVLLAEVGADGNLAALASARVDTAERASLGSLPAGQYASVTKTLALDDVTVVDLARAGSDVHDVLALRAGADPTMLAAG